MRFCSKNRTQAYIFFLRKLVEIKSIEPQSGELSERRDYNMKQVIKEAMGDCSTIEEFRFLLRCQECGRTWRSSPVRFSKADAEPETEARPVIFRALYAREREAAREKAAAEASEIFSQCPVCGRLVCDRCFLICEDLDLCTACAGKLKVRGDIVAGNVSSSQKTPPETPYDDSTEGDDAK